MAALTVNDLTLATVQGTGVFDVLMRANKAHLDAEYDAGRIKGSEYATVYLGSLQSVMSTAVAFLLQKDKNDLEARLLEQQIILAGVQVRKAEAELALLILNEGKLNAETALITQQKQNLVLQALNIPKEGLVLDGQKCKLDAEFDVLMASKLKTAQEADLLMWKVTTEKAQTLSMGVDPESVIGKQNALYAAQTSGFTRDAEQKAAKVMVDSWNVRRTTDETGVQGNTLNKLDDASVGRAVDRLLSGVNA